MCVCVCIICVMRNTHTCHLFHLQLHPPSLPINPCPASTKARNSVKDEESKCKSSRDTSGA